MTTAHLAHAQFAPAECRAAQKRALGLLDDSPHTRGSWQATNVNGRPELKE